MNSSKHLSKWPSDFQRNGAQEIEGIGPVFMAYGVILLRVLAPKPREASDWLLKYISQTEGSFLEIALATLSFTPHNRQMKSGEEND